MSIAVIIPCHNEAATVTETIVSFRSAVPEAIIWVCDNGSTDDTADRARAAGARVLSEPRLGKGHAVRRLFSDVEAQIYIMVDGDATYDAKAAPGMIRRLREQSLDMVVGNRLGSKRAAAFRPGHHLGNRLFSGVVHLFFGSEIKDLFSGYRVLSRRFVKAFPAESRGFEIETELTVVALESRLPLVEVEIDYFARPEGSDSKLNTVQDGLRILRAVFSLLRDVKPFECFGAIALALGVSTVIMFIPIFDTFLQENRVPRFPTVIVLTGTFILACISLTCGIILDRVATIRRMLHRLAYLAIPGVSTAPEAGSDEISDHA